MSDAESKTEDAKFISNQLLYIKYWIFLSLQHYNINKFDKHVQIY